MRQKICLVSLTNTRRFWLSLVVTESSRAESILVRAVPTRTAHTKVRCSFPFVAESCRCFVFHILSPLAPGRSSVAARCMLRWRLKRDALNLA